MEKVKLANSRSIASGSRIHSKTRVDSNDIRVHYSDDSAGGIRSSIHQRPKNYETSSSDITIERRRKAKQRYRSLIRPSAHVLQTGNEQKQKQQHHQRHKTFFEDYSSGIVQRNIHSVQLTPQKSNMNQETIKTHETCIYRWRSPSSIKYDSPQPRHAGNIATTATVQTTSISTENSTSYSSFHGPSKTVPGGPAIVSPSPSTESQEERIVIATDLSNLTESSSSDEPLRVNKTARFFKDTSTPGDQVLASIARLQEIERKRSVVRDQRFNLEQRLHNLRRVLIIPESVPENEEHRKMELKKVVNWKYQAGEHQILLYTGRLDAIGQPCDENALLRFGDDQIYKGGVQNGMRHGTGTNQWPDGQTYSGEWQNDSRNGRGTHIWRDGRTVTGNWKDGHLNGNIYFRWPNGAVFDGAACMGKKEGKGVTTRPDGTVYSGNYSNGKENGFGTLIRPDGSKYRGEFKNGLKEGYGIMLRPTQTYDGEWSNDRPHGQGRVVWPNGSMFTGQFQEGTYSGMGVYVWPSGKRFVGRWEKGFKHGHGVHTWPSGQVYDGAYCDGVREGYGRMAWPDGSVYCGGFEHNRRCGHGVQTNSSGAVVHCGLWKHDRPYGGPGDHEVLYVVRPPWKRSDKNPVSKEENEENQPKLHQNFSDEKMKLPSLPFLAPVIVTPREAEISSCDEVSFPRANVGDCFEAEGIEEEDVGVPEDMRIISSSRDYSAPASVRPTFDNRLLI